MADRADKKPPRFAPAWKERKRRKGYAGKLARPVRVKVGELTLDEAGSDEAREAFAQKVANEHNLSVIERGVKLYLLCDHYGVERGDWFNLAWELAHAHVPGFRVEDEKSSGRPKEWDMVRLLFLWWKVQEGRRKNPRRSVSEACKRLADDPDLAKMLRNAKQKTLQHQYEKALHSPLVIVLQKRTHEEVGQIMADIGPRLFASLSHE